MVSSASSASRAPETEGAAPVSSAPGAQPSADITVLTVADDFLLELAQALGGIAAVRPVDSIDAALAGLAGRRRAQVLVVDAQEPAEARTAVKTALMRAPHCVVLVFAAEAAQAAFSAALHGLALFALLPTPIDARKAHAAFEQAIAQAAARMRDAARTDTEEAAARAEPRTAHPAPERLRSRTPWMLAAAAAVLALLGAGAYWMFAAQRTGAAPAAAQAQPAALPNAAAVQPIVDLSIVQGKVDDLLERARAAMRARHYTDPPGDNALLYYRSAAAADPASGEAKDGLQRVAGVLGGRFDEAMTGGHLNAAALALAQIKAAAPDYAALAAYSQQLAAAAAARQRADSARRAADADARRLAGLVEERIKSGKLTDGDDSAKAYAGELQKSAPANPATARALQDLDAAYLRKARAAARAQAAQAAQADADRLAHLAAQRLRDGSLTDPANDSAAYYLGEIRANDPTYPGLAPASRALAVKLLARARAALLAGKSADQDLAAAQSFGADPQDILALRRLPAAAPAAGGSQGSASALAKQLKLLHAVQPNYPDGALERRIGGTVIVKFTVDAQGYTRHVGVAKATPAGLFERAALDAVRQWRYAPVRVNGKGVAVPTEILVRFKPPQ